MVRRGFGSVLEENWAGLEGQDDRSSFGDDRVQIMIRLHGCQQSSRPAPMTNFPLSDCWMSGFAIKGEVNRAFTCDSPLINFEGLYDGPRCEA